MPLTNEALARQQKIYRIKHIVTTIVIAFVAIVTGILVCHGWTQQPVDPQKVRALYEARNLCKELSQNPHSNFIYVWHRKDRKCYAIHKTDLPSQKRGQSDKESHPED